MLSTPRVNVHRHRPHCVSLDESIDWSEAEFVYPSLEDAIRNKLIKPYSDFLLHDMGSLGDGIEQGMGTGSQGP